MRVQPRAGGLEAEPLGEAGAARGHVAVFFTEARKAAVSCFRCWGPWELLSWQEEATGSAALTWGDGMPALERAEASLGSRAGPGHAEVSGSAAGTVPAPSATHPPSWQVAGCGVVGSSWDLSPLGSRSQASDFKDTSLV